MEAVLLEDTYPGVTYCGSHKGKITHWYEKHLGKVFQKCSYVIGVSSRSNYRVNNLDSTVVSSCFVTCVNESLNYPAGIFSVYRLFDLSDC